MAHKANQEIRDIIKGAGLRQWEVAAQAGISEASFIKWLRFPLEGERLERIQRAIAELKKGGVNRD